MFVQTIFQESTEDEIVNRILEINPKFRRIESVSSPGLTPNNGTHDHHEKLRSEQEGFYLSSSSPSIPLLLSLLEMSKRAAEIKTSASPYQHNDFIKALIEQQKLVQQQEHEHKQKLQQEQQVNHLSSIFPSISIFLPLGTRT